MIFPIWQPLYTSSHKLAQKCGEWLGEEATHTGTLDPMAEGVLVILTGDDRFAKGALGDWGKVYEFSILWGAVTDSLDRMGKITEVRTGATDIMAIERVLTGFPDEYTQQVPRFSAARVSGKSRQVKIQNLKLLTSEMISTKQALFELNTSVNKVLGDFRQAEILENWPAQLGAETDWLITHHVAEVSTGTYIRQLVQDLAQNVGCPATTWSITRTKNGPYEKQDCVDLKEVELL